MSDDALLADCSHAEALEFAAGELSNFHEGADSEFYDIVAGLKSIGESLIAHALGAELSKTQLSGFGHTLRCLGDTLHYKTDILSNDIDLALDKIKVVQTALGGKNHEPRD